MLVHLVLQRLAPVVCLLIHLMLLLLLLFREPCEGLCAGAMEMPMGRQPSSTSSTSTIAALIVGIIRATRTGRVQHTCWVRLWWQGWRHCVLLLTCPWRRPLLLIVLVLGVCRLVVAVKCSITTPLISSGSSNGRSHPLRCTPPRWAPTTTAAAAPSCCRAVCELLRAHRITRPLVGGADVTRLAAGEHRSCKLVTSVHASSRVAILLRLVLSVLLLLLAALLNQSCALLLLLLALSLLLLCRHHGKAPALHELRLALKHLNTLHGAARPPAPHLTVVGRGRVGGARRTRRRQVSIATPTTGSTTPTTASSHKAAAVHDSSRRRQTTATLSSADGILRAATKPGGTDRKAGASE